MLDQYARSLCRYTRSVSSVSVLDCYAGSVYRSTTRVAGHPPTTLRLSVAGALMAARREFEGVHAVNAVAPMLPSTCPRAAVNAVSNWRSHAELYWQQVPASRSVGYISKYALCALFLTTTCKSAHNTYSWHTYTFPRHFGGRRFGASAISNLACLRIPSDSLCRLPCAIFALDCIQ